MPFAKRTVGITANSTKTFIIDAGACYLNYGLVGERILGATSGGSTFTIEVEMRDMEIDGTIVPVKGTRRMTSAVPTVVVRLLECSKENLMLALAGSTGVDWSETGSAPFTHDKITRNRNIALADYVTNIALIGKVNGSADVFIGILNNALAGGGLEFSMEDESEAVLEVTFTGHIDASAIQDDGTVLEPWEIRMPKIV